LSTPVQLVETGVKKMKTRSGFRSSILLLGIAALTAGCTSSDQGASTGQDAAVQADLLLYGGKVVTVDNDFSIASAVAVKDGKILAVGGAELTQQYPASQRLDLKGRVLMPGFTDTHIHIRTSARRDVDLINVKSI